jgi:O-antigen/teichoic acid export membrane protein
LRKVLIKNSLSGVIQFIITGIITFLSIPILINYLGSEGYGLFALISVIGNLNVFANLGLNLSLTKFLAEQGKTTESNLDIIVTFLLLVIVLLPLTIVCLIFNRWILTAVLNVPFGMFDEAQGLYIFILIANFFLFIGNIFSAILTALQKIYIQNYIQLFYNFTYWGLIMIVLWIGENLKMIGITIMISALLWFILIIFYSIKEWGHIPIIFGLRQNFLRIAKKQVGYGYKIYISGLLILLYEPLTKILIGNFIGLKEAGFYEIAIKIRDYTISIIGKLLYPLFPLISQLTDLVKIRALVHDITQKALFITVPAISILIYITKPFINLWIGNNVDIISICVISITGIYLISVTCTPNFQFLTVKNHLDKVLLIQSTNVIINALIIVLFYNYLGFYAVIISNVTAIFLAYLITIFYQKKYLNSSIFDSKVQFFKLIIIFIILLGIGYLCNYIFKSDWNKIIFIPMLMIASVIILYREFSLFNINDIHRYLGKGNKISMLFKYILIKKQHNPDIYEAIH